MLFENTLPRVGGIYVIWLSETHYYGGRSRNVHDRVERHFKKLQEGTHINPHMQNCWNKYQQFNAELLGEYPLRAEQIKAEQAWLDKHVGKPGCLNLASSACGGGHSEETRRKMSKTRKGITHTEASRKKMSGIKARWHQVHTCPVKGRRWVHQGSGRKMVARSEVAGLLAQGWVLGQAGVSRAGKSHTEETRQRMREKSNRGWVWLHRGDERCVAPEDQVSMKLAEGWIRGIDAQKRVCLISPAGDISKRILPAEAAALLAAGWIPGRITTKPSFGQGARDAIARRHTGTRWMRHPKLGRRRVKPEDREALLAEGWAFGKS